MSYLPLAHSFERAVTLTVIAYAGRIGFYQGNINELFNDIAALRPTFLVGAPRVWSRLHDKLILTIDSGSPVKKKLFYWGFAAKQSALQQGQSTPLWDKILFSKTKARLGGRVRYILSGSAPLDPKLGEFLRICFCCDVLEGYGLTENSAGASVTLLEDTKLGHVGTPFCCIEVKLADVPEMNYSSKHNPPTGEVMLRGANVFKGYFNDPEKTKEALEPDGWFHTGDIGKWNPNGTLSIIDRKKNIFKLSQGEYVAVEYLEGIYKRSRYVLQVWVYGSSYKRFLIAFVVPDPDVLLPWAKQNGIDGDLKSLCDNQKVNQVVLDSLTAVGNEAKLKGFEFVKAIRLVPDPFVVETELITPTFKLRRPNLLKFFQKDVDALYATIKDAD
jgi:long-chain acyl-CoA synthetase